MYGSFMFTNSQISWYKQRRILMQRLLSSSTPNRQYTSLEIPLVPLYPKHHWFAHSSRPYVCPEPHPCHYILQGQIEYSHVCHRRDRKPFLCYVILEDSRGTKTLRLEKWIPQLHSPLEVDGNDHSICFLRHNTLFSLVRQHSDFPVLGLSQHVAQCVLYLGGRICYWHRFSCLSRRHLI
jgi:hypothetical protein